MREAREGRKEGRPHTFMNRPPSLPQSLGGGGEINGACTYDVCTGRGVPQKQTTVLISCMSVTVTRGEEVNKSKNFVDVICTCPLA